MSLEAYYTRGHVVDGICQAGCRVVERKDEYRPHETVAVVFLELSTAMGNREALEFEPEMARALAASLLSAADLVDLERKISK